MLDQCSISLRHEIPVNPEIFTNPHFLIHDFLHFSTASPRSKRRRVEEETETKTSGYFEIYADRALAVHTRQSELGGSTHQVISRIDLNPGKILRGHNGRPVTTDLEVCRVLTVVRHVLSGIVLNPADAVKLIPGIDEKNSSHWHHVEIAMNLRDPGQRVHKQMHQMRSPHIRRKSMHFEDHTTCLKGEKIDLKAYDKLKQMQSKHTKRGLEDVADPITRLEVVLKLNKFPGAFDFLPEAERPHTSNLDHKQRLLSFNLDHLKAAHRHYFSDLKGIYHAAKDVSDRSTAGFGATLAAISMRWQLPVPEILDLYRQTSGKAPGSIESTCREMRKQIERFLAESSIVTAEELLSDEAYRKQPPVDVKGLAGHAASYAKHFALDLDFDICKAYSSKRSGSKLDPDTSLAWE